MKSAARGTTSIPAVMVSWPACFHGMGMVGFLTIPCTSGPGLRSSPYWTSARHLLWAKLIGKYKGTIPPRRTSPTPFRKAAPAPGQRRRVRPVHAAVRPLRRGTGGGPPTSRTCWMPQAVRAAAGSYLAGLRHGRDHPGGVVLRVRRRTGCRRRLMPICWPHCAVPCRRPRTTLAAGHPGAVAARDLEARIVEDGKVLPRAGRDHWNCRGESLTPGYITMGGFVPAQDRTAGTAPATWAT